jgi:hypothetical protein
MRNGRFHQIQRLTDKVACTFCRRRVGSQERQCYRGVGIEARQIDIEHPRVAQALYVKIANSEITGPLAGREHHIHESVGRSSLGRGHDELVVRAKHCRVYFFAGPQMRDCSGQALSLCVGNMGGLLLLDFSFYVLETFYKFPNHGGVHGSGSVRVGA